jgi:hypothetical protein
MTAADNAHLAEVTGLVATRASKEFNLLFRRAAEYRTPTAASGEVRATTHGDQTASAAIANISGRVDPMTTLHGDLVKARQQAIWWCNRLLSLADQAVAVDTAERVRAGTDDRTVDDINRSDGYCAACGSPRYHHGVIGDRLILTHGALKCCESCRSRWRRTSPQTDSAWIDFLEDAKRRGLAARADGTDVEVVA